MCTGFSRDGWEGLSISQGGTRAENSESVYTAEAEARMGSLSSKHVKI